MPIAIEVENVTKEFRLGQLTTMGQGARNIFRRLRKLPADSRPPFKALDNLSFTVEQGEVLGIIGHNGAGKSTLLKLLSNISRPTHGAVRVNGRVAPLIEVGAGMVPDMTGRENIHLNASILGMSRAEIRRKFDEIVEFSELEKFIDTPVKRYSSGMQVKLGFAIATSVEAEILIIDEVLAVGDLAFQRKCFDRMEELIKRQGRTVLLVSHNIRQVERICSRVLLLDHGRCVAGGEPKAVCGTFYDQNDKRMLAQNGSARFESTGDIDLVEVALLDRHGAPADQIFTGDTIAIDFVFDVRKEVWHPVFGFGVHTTDLLYLSTEISEDRYRGTRLRTGRHKMRVTINSVPLLPGGYSLRVGLDGGDVTSNIFYAENVAPLLVRSRTEGRSQGASEGFFGLNVGWQLQEMPEHHPVPSPMIV